jgi:ATP-dependent Clp protease protease subunit
MKMNRLILGLSVILAILLIPKVSTSSGINPDTIVLSKGNLLVLDGEVSGESTSALIAKAKELDAAMNKGLKGLVGPQKPLYLFINSPGGVIQSGLELIEALHGIGRTVDTVTLFGASMAFQIVQNLDDRLILKNGVLMSHRAAGQFEGSFGGQHPSQVDSRYQLWLDRTRELDEQTVKRTNGKQTYESYTKEYDSEMWLIGTKAVSEGYADRIVTVKCDISLSGVTTHHVNFLGMDVSYDLDNCPINTSPMNVRISAPDAKSLTNEVKAEIEAKFMDKYNNKQKQVLPMVF